MAEMKYQTEITLYNSYFDVNDRLSSKSILNVFQDVASCHAENIGVGYQEMLKKTLYWILTRIKFNIVKTPLINQKVIVQTWPQPKGRIDFDRDFKILNESGETLIIGTSKWCVIDTVKRNLQRTDSVNYSGECLSDKNYTDGTTKIVVPDGEFQKKFDYSVKFSDLDHNKHMNNTNYANLVVSAVENKNFNHFEINFNNECFLDDKIIIYALKTQNGEYVRGINETQLCKPAFTAFVK